MATADYYAVLGVEPRASAEEIKRAFRRLTKQWHPDRHPDDVAVRERYTVINEAYNTLSDPSARAKYDATRLRQTSVELTQNFDVRSARDLLSNVFGDVFGTRRSKQRRGRNLKYTLTVDFAEAVLGTSAKIEFEAPGSCPDCSGSGTRPGGAAAKPCDNCDGKGEVKGEGLLSRRTRCGRCDGTGMIQIDPCEPCKGLGTRRVQRRFTVRLPPGTDGGAERILEGEGEPGRFGGEPGDLEVRVNVRPHRWLRREGDDIRSDVYVSVTEAAFGAKIPVPTVDGSVVVDVPAGITSGTKLRLRGKGVPRPDKGKGSKGRTRGDQLVTIMVETPKIAAAAAPAELRGMLEDLETRSQGTAVLPRRHEQRAAATEPDTPSGGDD